MLAAEIIDERQRYILTFFLFIIYFAYGFALAMIGPFMASIFQDYNLRPYQGGFLLAAQGLGGVIALFAGTVFIDRTDKIDLVIFLFLVFGLEIIFLGLPVDYYTLIFVFFLLGICSKVLDAAGNALIADAHPGRQGTYLALLHAFFGIGVFLGPLYAQIILRSQIAWKTIFLVCGILCLAILTFYYLAKGKRQMVALQTISAPGRSKQVMMNRKLWYLSLIMFLYVGQMFGITNWLTTYMEMEVGAKPSMAGFTLTFYGVGIILSRFLAVKLVNDYKPINLIDWGCRLSGGLLLVGIVSKMPLVTLVTVGLAGFFAGAVIPLVITVGCIRFPENTGTASSIIFLSGSLSAIMFPLLIEVVAEFTNFTYGISLTALGLILISLSIKWIPALRNEG